MYSTSIYEGENNSKMNKVFVAALIFLALSVVVISTAVNRLSISPTGEAIKDIRMGQLREISITEEGYDPQLLFVKSGDRIKFTNYKEIPETATSEYFGSPLLFQNDSYEFVIVLENITIDYFSMSNSNIRGVIRVLE